jgi:hypothetical protein
VVEDTEAPKNHQYYIRVRHGNWEVEVSAYKEEFVINESTRLIEEFKLTSASPPQPQAAIGQEDINLHQEQDVSRPIKPQTAGEFLRQFILKTNLEKILVLGYWCEMVNKQSSFTSEDILAKFKEVREKPPALIGRDLKSLVSRGFLVDEGRADAKSAYTLTNTGLKEVETKISKA